jgi:hypothetical protein
MEELRTALVGFTRANSIDTFSDVFPICQLGVSLLSRPTMQLRRKERIGAYITVYLSEAGWLTVMAATFHSAPILGISLWAVLRPSLTPVRILMVRGISPRARFIPIKIFPSFPAASSTERSVESEHSVHSKTDTARNVRAEPLPVLKTRSIGQPQFKSIKSMPPSHSLAITSAMGTSVAGLLPAICTPNIFSDGCRLTRDHSSLEPDRKDVARPTRCLFSFPRKAWRRKNSLSPHVMSAPRETQSRLKGWNME